MSEQNLGQVRISEGVSPEARAALMQERTNSASFVQQVRDVLVGKVVEDVTLEQIAGNDHEVLPLTVEGGRQVVLCTAQALESFFSDDRFTLHVTARGVTYGL